MRRLVGVQSCLAVFFAFSEAPQLHFHLDADSEHARQVHDGRGIANHHRPGLAAEQHHRHGAAIEAAPHHDDDAVFVNWLPAGPQAQAPFVAALAASPPLVAPSITTQEPVFGPVPRSHDPPCGSPARPRSPPAFPPAV